MDDCVFCAIIEGKIPSYKIYEDDRVFAFLDIAEDADGHTLVVPKKHCRNIMDCDDDELACLIRTVKKIAAHYVESCGFEGANILSFAEPCAGQTVFHLHFHVIPRVADDGVFAFPRFKKCRHTLEEMQKKLALTH
jgi:histidine triad (HIT) family protein